MKGADTAQKNNMQDKKFVLSIGDDGAQEAELNRFLGLRLAL